MVRGVTKVVVANDTQRNNEKTAFIQDGVRASLTLSLTKIKNVGQMYGAVSSKSSCIKTGFSL